MLENIGEYWLLMLRVFEKPERWRIFWRQYVNEAHKLIISSIPIVSIISLFIGAVLVLQTAYNIENPFIPKMYVGYMVRESLILEFCSTMVALILAGKMGSNIASEIGTMRVTQQIDALDIMGITEQIDAMEIMGINSANYLILPKIVSSVTLSPLLMLTSFMVGLLGGGLIVIATGVINLSDYITGLQFSFNSYYIVYSMIKMSVFAYIITSVASYWGYYAKGGSLGVGKSSTIAIVASSLLILIFNLVLTHILL